MSSGAFEAFSRRRADGRRRARAKSAFASGLLPVRHGRSAKRCPEASMAENCMAVVFRRRQAGLRLDLLEPHHANAQWRWRCAHSSLTRRKQRGCRLKAVCHRTMLEPRLADNSVATASWSAMCTRRRPGHADAYAAIETIPIVSSWSMTVGPDIVRGCGPLGRKDAVRSPMRPLQMVMRCAFICGFERPYWLPIF
jgi:hypothetical protein